MPGRSFDEDPLTLAIAPPPDETYEQRQIREAAEAEAKRISDEIDEQIRKEREAEKKKKKPVKLLLLGASMHSTSAVLTNLICGRCSRPERERQNCNAEKFVAISAFVSLKTLADVSSRLPADLCPKRVVGREGFMACSDHAQPCTQCQRDPCASP
jgi:ribosomal protein L14E/L6E/L27E